MIIKDNINWGLAETIIGDSFDQLTVEFKSEQEFQIKDPKWQWPRETERKVGKYSGKTVTTPRDIVDTGELLDSLSVIEITRYIVLYRYLANYAAYVHFGSVLNNGTELPSRPWIFSAIKHYKILESFADILSQKL